MVSLLSFTCTDQLEEKILKYNETELSTPKYNLEPIKSGAALEVMILSVCFMHINPISKLCTFFYRYDFDGWLTKYSYNPLKINTQGNYFFVVMYIIYFIQVFGTEITNPTGKCKSISLVNNEKLTDIAITQKHVVQNVSNLLQRIEEDRSNTEKLLYIEQCRTKSLQQKIDTHAYKRIHELPDAIQKGLCKSILYEVFNVIYQIRNIYRSKIKLKSLDCIDHTVSVEC